MRERRNKETRKRGTRNEGIKGRDEVFMKIVGV
jgi:hypothetical protein